MKCLNAKGFSLVEIAFVIVVIAALAGVAFPMFLKWLPNMTLKAEANAMVSSLQQAKIEAISKNIQTDISFTDLKDGCHRTYQVKENVTGTVISSLTLDNDVCLKQNGGYPTGFNSMGVALSNGGIDLTHPDLPTRTYTVTVSPAGGITL